MKNIVRAVLFAAGLAATALMACGPTCASAEDKVILGTDWKAQAGHGGFYQALADGTYKKYGLDVEIREGGPQVNNRPMLSAGKIDFLIAGNLLLSFDNVKNHVPTVVVAAVNQKDPQALMAHEGAGFNTFADLKKAKVILVSKDGQFSFWQWMVAEKGFKDEQLRPYNYSIAQFLAEPGAVQQAYATAEPLYAENAGVKTRTFLLADEGWNTYSSTIETRWDMVKNKPDVVRRFIDASIIGWYNFLYGDHSGAYGLIEKENPEMTQAKLDAEVAKIRQLGLIDSGDALTKGIGAIDTDRVKSFYDKMVKAGLYKAQDVDISKVATNQFVDKGVGLDLRKKLVGQSVASANAR
ncbi:ABC transporter substrate-binding protein [Paraburkholderia agricolaris]|jgi:NitT/TauT family transport system substrate-binding protein|uniref:ABC transporter substrate-binding protein n=1 Tax=Paraburkholderia agricolaris TaxID=2152888 RepID=A0ABW8ZNK9_9BURK|nr:ABC transporter substrate-binding protein [Paraburkholderia agricolaris]